MYTLTYHIPVLDGGRYSEREAHVFAYIANLPKISINKVVLNQNTMKK